MEEAQCAGLPGKPAATQACHLQRCAAWHEEPWGEVRPPAGGEEIGIWVLGLGQGWEVGSLPWKQVPGDKVTAGWVWKLWPRLG